MRFVVIAYGLIVPGLILRLFAIGSAVRSARVLDVGSHTPPHRLLFAPPH